MIRILPRLFLSATLIALSGCANTGALGGRHYLVHLPRDYRADQPRPLVIVLHGAFSRARGIERESGWSDLANREGFIVVYPEGRGRFGLLQHWNAGHCCGKAAAENWDDVGFLRDVVDRMRRDFAIDEQRVYMVGFSNGGMLTYRFAMEHPAQLAAACCVSGAINSRTAADQPLPALPPPAGPVPFMILHGDRDRIIPIDGGRRRDRDYPQEYVPAEDAVRYWRRANRDDANVRFIRLRDWGHVWPGGPATRDLPADHPLHGFDAAEVIWEFFREHAAQKFQ